MEESKVILNDRYKLLERAGSGGMAVVYKGQDLMLGRTVAVKILHESLIGDEQFLLRFQKEAHSAANLSHPNIVTVHDIGQDGRRYFIVMEYVEGSTLKDLIRTRHNNANQPLPISLALNLVIQICAGVGYAHRAQIIHCDIKSQNVLVTPDDLVKVTDFGIARALSESSLHEDSHVWGTPQYFSPEQAAGQSPTPATDVYSIGVILFEMLTGRLPFTAESHTALALKHMQEPPPLVSSINPAVPEQLSRIVTKILSKEPAGRYRTAEQLGRVLDAYRINSLEDTGPINGSPSEGSVITEADTQPVLSNNVYSLSSAQTRLSSKWEKTGEQADIFLALDESDEGIDWLAVVLGLLTLAALLGLIPLWYSVYQLYIN